MAGMLQRAIAGGAQALQGMAQGAIEDERRLDMTTQLGALEEQRAMRLEKYRQDLSLDGEKKRITELSPLQREQSLRTAADTQRQTAALGVELAPQQAAAQGIITKAQQANETNPEYVKALASREAALARARDTGGGLRAVQTESAQLDVKDKKRLGDLYDQQAAILNSDLDDATKQVKLKPIQTQIQSIKSKNAPLGARDPELDTQTVVTEVVDPATGVTTKTTRKEVRKPTGGVSADPLGLRDDKPKEEQPKPQPKISPVASRPLFNMSLNELKAILSAKGKSSAERAAAQDELSERERVPMAGGR